VDDENQHKHFKVTMPRTFQQKTKRQQLGNVIVSYVIGLLCLCVQTSFAAERWKIVVLPDKNNNTPNELTAVADFHRTISQGLTNALTNADFDVLNLDYLGLPNCILEDCSNLTDQTIQLAANRSGREVNLALLYRLNTFKQRQSTVQKWYFSLSGRLLDLQSGAQQDAFSVESRLNPPAKNCIADCLNLWLNQNLALLAQDLGAVLSEKLQALPRRFHYQLNLSNFNSAELLQIDKNLKTFDGYVADTLLSDPKPTNQDLATISNRTYQYVSELSASELSAALENLNTVDSLLLKVEYDNIQRSFHIIGTEKSAPWVTFSQFITGLLDNSEPEIIQPPSEVTATTTPETSPTDAEKEIQKDRQMWQQALGINSKDSYQQYLTIWPQGQHFIQAKAAIKRFDDDENAWQQALSQTTSQAFQHYLRLRPTGKYANQAKQQLALIREQQKLVQKQRENKALADDYYHQQQNYPEALYYYEQAATLGDISSQYLLAKMYDDGKGIEQNKHQAAIWYTQAAELGHSQAQVTLGYMYSKGNGVNQDYSQAAHWYLKAATQGHIDAQHNLAYLYSLGQGVAKDYQQAAFWYEKSAIQGDADAQNSLGKLYERGLGVSKDLIKAKSLYKQAAAQGNQIAQLNLQMLNN
jgi:TPR repeat protein